MNMATGAIVPGAIETCWAEYWVVEKLFHGGLRRKPDPSREGRGQDGALQFRRPGMPAPQELRAGTHGRNRHGKQRVRAPGPH